ncbi:MAG: hypothetical protein H6Q26_1304 [Bacteroidetes bacterium]|nr:hypothetical protein [Bacteroidota bacterium]
MLFHKQIFLYIFETAYFLSINECGIMMADKGLNNGMTNYH